LEPDTVSDEFKNLTADDFEILNAQDWSFPVPIAYGPGRLADWPKLARSV